MGTIYHHGSRWVNQYSHRVGFKFSTTQVTGYPIGLVSQSNYQGMWNWSNHCWWGSDGQIILRVILHVVEPGYTVSGYIWCQICREPQKRLNNDCIYCSMLYFLKYS